MQSDTAFGGGNADSQAVTIPDRQTDKKGRINMNNKEQKKLYVDTVVAESFPESMRKHFEQTISQYDLYNGTEPDTMKVCEHCLMAIESREGKQITRTIDVDYADDETELKCDWCGETEIDRLFELL